MKLEQNQSCGEVLTKMHIPDSIDIEGVSATLPQSFLHGSLLRGRRSCVVEPVGVDGTGGTTKDPCNSSRGVSTVHHAHLCGNLGVTAKAR